MQSFLIRCVIVFGFFTTLCCEKGWSGSDCGLVPGMEQIEADALDCANYSPGFLNDFSDSFFTLARGSESGRLPSEQDSFRIGQWNVRNCIHTVNTTGLKTTFVENSIRYAGFLVDRHLYGYYLFSLCRLLI